jgi:dimethyladenosine transferase 1
VIQGNMLTIDHQEIINAASTRCNNLIGSEEPIHIMGNLPFNIATPLLLQWLHQQTMKEGLFGLQTDIWMTLMFQKEVGDVNYKNDPIL